MYHMASSSRVELTICLNCKNNVRKPHARPRSFVRRYGYSVLARCLMVHILCLFYFIFIFYRCLRHFTSDCRLLYYAILTFKRYSHDLSKFHYSQVPIDPPRLWYYRLQIQSHPRCLVLSRPRPPSLTLPKS
ncbi:hypothetical protein Micbo1qcDRAFT_27022 [Microdochium bolleyi]|uniref:Uncharacterized protein n=1 Tax=Microdochium bolleyi TaxID=196109 RepID=A0A136JEC9_9PEZI|nr:hypothetical protein Micbo1qcDRAFT_27022 [Microdochium bolleyi]